MSNVKNALYVRTIEECEHEYCENKSDRMMAVDEADDDDAEEARGDDDDHRPPSPDRRVVVEGDDAPVDAPRDDVAVVVTIPEGRRGGVIAIEEDDDDNNDEMGDGVPRDAPRRSATTPDSSQSTTNADATDRDAIPRPSFSSPRRYTDALHCGGRRPHYPDILSCDRSAAASYCGNNHTMIGGEGGGGGAHVRSMSSYDARSGIIALSSIVSTYGEECNICLSQFQVGDHAAWRSRRGADDRGEVVPCNHVFHEECITRWLLVRDRCPICRETYFPESNSSSTGTIVAPIDVGRDLERGGNGVDDGVTVEEMRSTPLVRRIIERFGSTQ